MKLRVRKKQKKAQNPLKALIQQFGSSQLGCFSPFGRGIQVEDLALRLTRGGVEDLESHRKERSPTTAGGAEGRINLLRRIENDRQNTENPQ